MATRKLVKGNPTTTGATTDAVEERLVAFAEQLGTLVGTVQAKTEGWLDREALETQLAAIRDRASELLDQMTPAAVTRAAGTSTSAARRMPTAKARSAAKSSRGLVDAPGKRHRKPPPQTKVSQHASAPKTRVIGNPGLKTGRRGSRG
jgi:hypothetical protein